MGKKSGSYQKKLKRYHKARADREEAEAELAKIELAPKRGDLLDARVIKKLFVDAAKTTRDRIMNVARRVTPEFVGLHSEAEIADKLNAELESALLELSEDVIYGNQIFPRVVWGWPTASSIPVCVGVGE